MKTIQNLLIALFLLFTIGSINAQITPPFMNYQAVIRNASNELVTDQSVGVQVSIIQESESGTVVFTEIYDPVPQTNANGLLTLEIGSGIPVHGSFASIDWSAHPYFIKIETDLNGGTSYTLTGISKLASVPYALYAANGGGTGWKLEGNIGTDPGTHFIGTVDNQDVVFKRSNVFAGMIGANSTSLGAQSGSAGYNNTAIGVQALKLNTYGFDNTAVGYNSLASNVGGQMNTAIGSNAMEFNTLGLENTAIGSDAMYANTLGSYNSTLGNYTLYRNTEGHSNTVIGYSSMVYNTLGDENTAIGRGSLFNNITGNKNTALGYNSLFNTTGSNNVGIGAGAQVPNAAGFNQIRIGDSEITYAGTQVAWSVTSDKRWKENIKTSDLGLDFIKDLKPVSYHRKNDKSNNIEYGIIAQELENSLKKFGAAENGMITKDDEGMYSVRYNDLFAPLIKAIQEQQMIIEDLKSEIEILKNK